MKVGVAEMKSSGKEEELSQDAEFLFLVSLRVRYGCLYRVVLFIVIRGEG